MTGRELDALGLIAAGRTTPAVAATLGLATHTVKGYVKSAMRKLGAETRVEAVMLARRTASSSALPPVYRWRPLPRWCGARRSSTRSWAGL